MYVRIIEGLNDVNLKGGIDDSYSRLKTNQGSKMIRGYDRNEGRKQATEEV